jgi:catechol 2,3-dioxygenase-like lactoylglutathione lyase family enzyme
MIGYVTLGTNKYDEAAAFYDALLGDIGAGRFMESDSFIAWAVSPGAPALSIIKPQDGNAATVALELGGTDEGAPGPRGDGGFYAGYFRDLDGNKLNAFCMT